MIPRTKAIVGVILLSIAVLGGTLYVTYQPRLLLVREVKVMGPDAPAYYAIVRGEPLQEIQRRLDEDPEIIDNFFLNGKTLLAMSVKYDRNDVIPLLLTRSADPNGAGAMYEFTPLMIALIGNNIEAARILLDHGADPSAQSSALGMSPLAYARQQGKSGFVDLFEEHPESEDVSDEGGGANTGEEKKL